MDNVKANTIEGSKRESINSPDTATSDIRQLRVCIFPPQQDEFPEKGERTDILSLAEHLSKSGHDVTIVEISRGSTKTQKSDHTAAAGVRFLELSVAENHDRPNMEISHAVYQLLKTQTFDVMQFSDRMGYAYYCLLAKRQGLAFQNSVITIALSGSSTWARRNQNYIPSHLNDLIRDFQERKSIELADALLSADQQWLDWMISAGWKLPDCRLLVQNNATVQLHYSQISNFLESLFHSKAGKKSEVLVSGNRHCQPLVSVILVHFNRPARLQEALQSLRDQTYSNFEVILVDDGSSSKESVQALAELESEFESRDWQLLRQENRYIGAARNTGAGKARGEYLIFMDDDNYAKPHEVETLMKVALKTGADIVTCAMDTFKEPDINKAHQDDTGCYLFLGHCQELWLFDNHVGDANSLMRKETFERLGGFTEDRNSTWEDFELFNKAELLGAHIETIPESLYRYRVAPDSMFRTSSRLENYARALRPYLPSVPENLQEVMILAQGFHYSNEQLAFELHQTAPLLSQLQAKLRHTLAEEVSTVQPLDRVNDWDADKKTNKFYRRLIRRHRLSRSWTIRSKLHAFLRALRLLPPAAVRSSPGDPATELDELQNSIWWNLSGPLRALRQVVSQLGHACRAR